MKFISKKCLWSFMIFLLILPGMSVGKNDEFSLDDLELFNRLHLNKQGQNLLKKNGFVVIPGHEKEIFDVYINSQKKNHPIFITTDAMLHTSHIFFDIVLRILETQKLYDFTRELTDRMLRISKEQYQEADDKEVRHAARLNIGYFAVAKKILEPDYEPDSKLEDLVSQELENISQHNGIQFRALLDYVEQPSIMMHPYAYEDYSQYVPRGHYTRNDLFKKYFKVMMWYGRIDFKLKPGKTQQAEVHGRKMTLQALLMVEALLKDERAYDLWNKVYKPTSYLVGKADDLSVEDYGALIKRIFPSDEDVDKFHKEEKLSEFIQEAMELKPPQILSGISYEEDQDFQKSTLGFRFMGQRFIPDSYVFQQLVYGVKRLEYLGDGEPFTMEIIPNVGPARAFPRGLDLLAVLGSQRALEILNQQGDTEYREYDEQLDKLRQEFSSLSQEQWTQNLYWKWLYSLIPLLEGEEWEYTPDFMKNQAWNDKELLTALGSWTELRHDTILYGKQSYTGMGRAPAPQPKLTYGYVEPYPRVYQRIKDMMTPLREMSQDLGIAIPEVQDKIKKFEDLLVKLQRISEKELETKLLTEEEYSFIWNIGSTLKELNRFPQSLETQITSEADEQMDIIADVHTDPNTSQVLEEGVGSPFHIYVIIKDHKGPRLCHGAVFSYYEFKHPLEDRLTDEKWQEMEKKNQRPPLPLWTHSFIAVSQAAPVLSLDFDTDNFHTHTQQISRRQESCF